MRAAPAGGYDLYAVMLVVRSSQLETLSKALDQSFADGLAADLARFWPETCAEIGEDEVHARVALGVERARAYGLDARGDVARYVNTMFALGPGFDADERYPWAGPHPARGHRGQGEDEQDLRPRGRGARG